MYFCTRVDVTTTQVHMRLCECHMTFNKFQTLIAFQSMITAGRGLERRNFDLEISILNSLKYS